MSVAGPDGVRGDKVAEFSTRSTAGNTVAVLAGALGALSVGKVKILVGKGRTFGVTHVTVPSAPIASRVAVTLDRGARAMIEAAPGETKGTSKMRARKVTKSARRASGDARKQLPVRSHRKA